MQKNAVARSSLPCRASQVETGVDARPAQSGAPITTASYADGEQSVGCRFSARSRITSASKLKKPFAIRVEF